jgi:hypothetical protein
MNTINKPLSQISWNQLYSEVLAQDDLDRLNVAPQSSDQKINYQFRKLAIQYHPDKNKDFTQTSSKIFQLISDSKETLLGTPVSSRLHESQFVFQRQETEDEKETRRNWENIKKMIAELEIIDNLSLYEARNELAHNSQSSIPRFDKASALQERISYLEREKTKEKIRTICSIASWSLICISAYFSAKNNPKAPIHRLIKYLKTKPSTPEIDFSGVSCNLS